jgi:hypothetical protein
MFFPGCATAVAEDPPKVPQLAGFGIQGEQAPIELRAPTRRSATRHTYPPAAQIGQNAAPKITVRPKLTGLFKLTGAAKIALRHKLVVRPGLTVRSDNYILGAGAAW